MKISVTGHSIVSAYGVGSDDTFNSVLNGKSKVDLNTDDSITPIPTYISRIGEEQFSKIKIENQTRLESMMISAIADACSYSNVDLKDENTLLIISTTKGNIDLLARDDFKGFGKKRSYLSQLANELKTYFNAVNQPIVISNACISGGCSIELAQDFLLCNRYKNVVVCGGDVLTEFVVSGFHSFHAISEGRSKPYDSSRDGINLGEAAAVIVLSSKETSNIQILGASTRNDANHISGPSRTGEGLHLAIETALISANLEANDIDYISAHGTATNYNDEMESIAFGRSSLSKVPVNSYKGYFGHTLGAAGVIESILAIKCLEQNVLIQSLGYSEHGVSEPLNVITKTESKKLKYVLKTGSGFGGGNNALIFGKI